MIDAPISVEFKAYACSHGADEKAPDSLGFGRPAVFPLCGSIAASSCTDSETIPLNGPQLIGLDQSDEVPDQGEIWWNPNIEWWEVTSLDEDRNGIHDSIQTASGPVNIGLSYSREFTEIDRNVLRSMGFEIHVELPVVNAVLLGDVEPSQIDELARIEGVVMV